MQIKDLDETFNKMAIEKYTNKNAFGLTYFIKRIRKVSLKSKD